MELRQWPLKPWGSWPGDEDTAEHRGTADRGGNGLWASARVLASTTLNIQIGNAASVMDTMATYRTLPMLIL